MICKLCLEEKQLLKKSHIVPDFMYKGIYDEKHKIVHINLDNLKNKSHTYSGIYDKNILCASCDNEIISKLETYVSNCIYFNGSLKSRSHIEVEKFDGGDDFVPFIRLKNLDYTRTKLFFLSILWRAHISKQPFFENVNLGKYAEKLRLMILNNDAGHEDKFEVVLVLIDSDGTRIDKAIISPRHLKLDGNSSFVFHINQIMYHFNISSYNKLSLYESGIVRNDGIMEIAVIREKFAREYFDSYLGQTILMKSKIVR